MRNFNASTTAALEAETAKTFWFMDLEFDSGTLRYSDADITLYSGGNAYTPNSFTISNIRMTADMAIDRAQVEIQNTDLVMSGTLLNETAANRTVKIYFGCLNSSNAIIALEEIFQGFITAWGGMTVRTCPLVLGNYFMLWSKRSLRIAQATCPWAFASASDPECGYSGSETKCNKTWTRCGELANTNNFGGFRWLPALEEKKIWWGVVPGAKVQ